MNPFVAASIGSVVRWALTIAAARGLATDSEQQQLADAIVLVITLGWSVAHKWQAAKAGAR